MLIWVLFLASKVQPGLYREAWLEGLEEKTEATPPSNAAPPVLVSWLQTRGSRETESEQQQMLGACGQHSPPPAFLPEAERYSASGRRLAGALSWLDLTINGWSGALSGSLHHLPSSHSLLSPGSGAQLHHLTAVTLGKSFSFPVLQS